MRPAGPPPSLADRRRGRRCATRSHAGRGARPRRHRPLPRPPPHRRVLELMARADALRAAELGRGVRARLHRGDDSGHPGRRLPRRGPRGLRRRRRERLPRAGARPRGAGEYRRGVRETPMRPAAVGEAGRAAAAELTWERNARLTLAVYGRRCARSRGEGRSDRTHADTPPWSPLEPRPLPPPAERRPPAVVLQVSYANGLGVIRDLAAARRAGPRPRRRPARHSASLALRRRHGLPRPARRRGGLHRSSSRSSAAASPSGAPSSSHARRVHLAALAPRRAASSPGSSSPSRAGTPWSGSTTSASRSRRRGGSASTRRGPSSSTTRPTSPAWRRGDRLPGHPQAGRVAGLQAALPSARPRDRDRARAREVVRRGPRLRHADAAGASSPAATRSCTRWARTSTRSRGRWRCSPATSCVSTHRRFGHVSMAVSRWVAGARRGRACACFTSSATTASARWSSSATRATAATASWRSTRVTGCGTRWPTACGVNLSLAAYRDAIGEPFVAPRQMDGHKWVVSLTDARDAFAHWRRGQQQLGPWIRSYSGVKVDGLLSLRDPAPRRAARRQTACGPSSRARASPPRARPRDVPMTSRLLTIFADVPDAFAPRAAGSLETLLAPLGRGPRGS